MIQLLTILTLTYLYFSSPVALSKMKVKEIHRITIESDAQDSFDNSGPILDSHLEKNGLLWLVTEKSIWKWDLNKNLLSFMNFNQDKKYSLQKILVTDETLLFATNQGIVFFDRASNEVEYVGISIADQTTSIALRDGFVYWQRSKATYRVPLATKQPEQISSTGSRIKPKIFSSSSNNYFFEVTPERVEVFDAKTRVPLQEIKIVGNKEVLKAKLSDNFHVYALSDNSIEIYDLQNKQAYKGVVPLNSNVDALSFDKPNLVLLSNGAVYAYHL